MPRTARVYVAGVASAAVLAAAVILPGARWGRVDLVLFFVLAALQGVILVTSTFPKFAESPGVPASVAVQLAAVVLLPQGVASASMAVGGLCIALRPGTPIDRMVFVVSGVFLTPVAGEVVYGALHGSRTLMRPEMPAALMPMVFAALALTAVPALLVGTMTVVGGRVRAKAALREAMRRIMPRNVAYSFAGLLAAVLWRHQAPVLATLVMIGPLLVTRWAYEQYAEQRAAHDATVRALVQAVEIKDLYTRGHSERVAKGSEMIARWLGMEEERISILRYAAILHDVGKLGVPTRLLQKDGKFDEAELETIRVHPVRGVDVVRDIAFLNEAYTAILHHHERMDGRGYPTGLAGERIPRFARIIAVADAFDSMTSTRSYRPARSVPDALAELRGCAGSQFDPVIVEAMHQALAHAEREGKPWLGDGTLPVFARSAPRRAALADAGALEAVRAAGVSGVSAGGPTDGAASSGACPLRVRARSGAVCADTALPCPHGDKCAADGFDHDDPAFMVPSPLSERSLSERSLSERERQEPPPHAPLRGRR
ncbi:HD-GYP domain-containing protein [Actinocrinis puniceicyclus]|uniref:HD-GYP domain-containing protein n=2 Tax=Actinocrinis puniceicyclus TaxID=977794 RepID=A0A8J7WKC0_9ACTN|nr:HD-GYP domain-containing protein [Actinocrinis puniceicyclus]